MARNSGHCQRASGEGIRNYCFYCTSQICSGCGGKEGAEGLSYKTYFIFNRKWIGFENFSLSAFQAVKLSHGPALHSVYLELFCFA